MFGVLVRGSDVGLRVLVWVGIVRSAFTAISRTPAYIFVFCIARSRGFTIVFIAPEIDTMNFVSQTMRFTMEGMEVGTRGEGRGDCGSRERPEVVEYGEGHNGSHAEDPRILG